jgi:transposase
MTKTQNSSTIVRSARISTAILNKSKKEKLSALFKLCKKAIEIYVNEFWRTPNLPKQCKVTHYNFDIEKVSFLNNSRLRQTICNQAFEMISSITAKIKKLEFYHSNALRSNMLQHAKSIMERITKLKNTKPEITNFSLNLNGNFIEFNEDFGKVTRNRVLKEDAKHKNWIKVTNIGEDKILLIPFIKTKIYNKYNNDTEYKRSDFIQVYENGEIKVVFTCVKEFKQTGSTEGCDIGINKDWVLSSGIESNPPKYNNKIGSVMELLLKIVKCKSNTVKSRKLYTFRDNYINYSINHMKQHLKTVKTLKIEKIHIKSHSSVLLSHWTYGKSLNKISRICEENNVEVLRVCPQNTSRMCNKCKWVFVDNRSKDDCEKFKCTKCKHEVHADHNASLNIRDLNANEIIKHPTDMNINSIHGFYYIKK